jgi:hypothetical protein
VTCERLAQLDPAVAVLVVERRVRRGGGGAGDRLGPEAAREERDVGRGRGEVEAPPLLGRRGRRGRSGLERLADHGRAGALARGEPALGRELLVGVGDHAARDTELLRECARRGQADPGAQAARADRVTQPGRELPAQRLASLGVERDEQLVGGEGGSGGHARMIGPVAVPVNGSGRRAIGLRSFPA